MDREEALRERLERIKALEEEIAARAELYRGQLLAYAEALSRIFQKNVKEGVLFFLTPGREVRVF